MRLWHQQASISKVSIMQLSNCNKPSPHCVIYIIPTKMLDCPSIRGNTYIHTIIYETERIVWSYLSYIVAIHPQISIQTCWLLIIRSHWVNTTYIITTLNAVLEERALFFHQTRTGIEYIYLYLLRNILQQRYIPGWLVWLKSSWVLN